MWWPETDLNRRRQPFQGLLPTWPIGLESAEVIEIAVVTNSRFGTVWAGLGCFRGFDVRILFGRIGIGDASQDQNWRSIRVLPLSEPADAKLQPERSDRPYLDKFRSACAVERVKAGQ